MKRTMIVLALLVVLLMLTTIGAAAMSSGNYRLDWFTPGTSGGGGHAISTNYAVNITVGQSVISTGGISTSTSYHAGLGYWYGMSRWRFKNLLPLAHKD
jgi:hypothetical protein